MTAEVLDIGSGQLGVDIADISWTGTADLTTAEPNTVRLLSVGFLAYTIVLLRRRMTGNAFILNVAIRKSPRLLVESPR
jgi:hypothetical protein